jgi:hypothetical protein
MLFHVTMSAQRDQIFLCIISLLTTIDFVMDLQVFQRSALSAPPSITI